ncbi:MAG: hypothetical protein P8H39_02630 [Thalassotalea sp.]|nr:hypothetical protein [Thalassotalea sp.]
MPDDEEYQYQHPDVLPLKLEVKDIHEYISRHTKYGGERYILDRINDDSMPIRIKIGDNSELARYNACLIDSIEIHQTDSKRSAFKTHQRFKRYTFKILSVKHNLSDKPIDVSSDNILLTASDMYADRDEIKEYKAKDLALPDTKKTKSRASSKKEEKQERIIAILVNLLAKESVKAKSSKYIKGEGNMNTLAISKTIVELADEYKINNGLTSDTNLAIEINAILNQYPNLKNI